MWKRCVSPTLTICLAAASICSAQLAPSSDAPPPRSAAPAQVEEAPVVTIKTTTNLVTVFFTVTDKHGALTPHLTARDCTVSEDNAPQQLKSFTAETGLPLTIGLLLDTSISQQRVLPLEQEAGAAFLQRALRAKDEAFLVSFDVNVDLLQDYTNSAARLKRALDRAQINAGVTSNAAPTHGARRGTLLYDAVRLAAEEKMSQEAGRKVILLMTDGEDQGSQTKPGEAIAAAQKANIAVYVIMITDRSFYGPLGYNGYSAMKKLTEETGGRLIDVGDNGKKLTAAFGEIEEALRTQYVATYRPANSTADGAYHNLKVTCSGEGLKTSSRKGYYAIAAEP